MLFTSDQLDPSYSSTSDPSGGDPADGGRIPPVNKPAEVVPVPPDTYLPVPKVAPLDHDSERTLLLKVSLFVLYQT
tara:strand:- start:991 stop:1218 length:228 start_codon:yes stop_codon:yes gene_type:complete